MVSESDRGQLLLVGGIVLGVVILGTVVLLNDMKFNDTIGSQGNQQALQNADRVEEMIRNDLRRMVPRVRDGVDSSNFPGAFNENVSHYSEIYSNMTFEDGIVFVDISFNSSASKDGRFLRQSSTDSFTFRSSHEWTAAKDATFLAPLVFTVEDFPDNDGNFNPNTTIRVTGAQGNVWELRINRSETNPIDGPAFVAVVNGEQERVESVEPGTTINLTNGELIVPGESRTPDITAFKFSNYVTRPYDLEIDNHFNSPSAGTPKSKLPHGTYRIGTDSRYLDTQNGVPDIAKLQAARPAVDITYQRPELQYTTTIYLNATGGGV